MPVAGLPATLETLLTSLLATSELSSWKVTGERGTTVVVLRFREDDGRPLPARDDQRGFWKRKTPAQRRRDQQRADHYRAKGEQKASVTLFHEYANENVATSIVCDTVSERNSRVTAETDHVASSSVTFDLPSAPFCSETEPAASPVITTIQEPPTVTTQPSIPVHHPDLSPPSASKDVPRGEMQAALQRGMGEMGEAMTRGMEKMERAVREGVAGVCSAMGVSGGDQVDRNGSSPALPPMSTDRPSDFDQIFRRIRSQSSSGADTTTPAPCASDSPAYTRDMFVNKGRTEMRRAPPTRQLPTRSARKK